MIILDLGGLAAQLVGGTMLLALPVAVLAGLVSFFSPCVVPLLPGYVSYATGLGAADVIAGKGSTRGLRGRMLAGMILFVLGFAAVFVATGMLIAGIGVALITWTDVITRIVGVITILLGLIFLGIIPLGRRDLRLRWVPRVGVATAPLLGIAFGLGWTPCIGPTLGAVYSLALTQGSALRGGILAFAYALGLGVPFVIAGVAFTRINAAVGVLRRHQRLIMRIGGVLLVVVGVMMVTGAWQWFTGLLRQSVSSFLPVI